MHFCIWHFHYTFYECVNSWPWHGAMPYPWNTDAMEKHFECNYIFIKETVNYPWRCFQLSDGKHVLSLTWKHAILKYCYRVVVFLLFFSVFRVVCCGWECLSTRYGREYQTRGLWQLAIHDSQLLLWCWDPFTSTSLKHSVFTFY